MKKLWHIAIDLLKDQTGGGVVDIIEDIIETVWEFATDVVSAPFEWAGWALEQVFEAFAPAIPDIPELGHSPTYGSEQIINTVSAGAPISIAFGKVKVGGNKVRVSSGTTKRDYIITVCEGQIGAFSGVSVNDIKWASLTGSHTKTEYSGSTTQTADSRFGVKAQAYRNTAYLALSLIADNQVSGDPNVTSIINAKKIEPVGNTAIQDYTGYTEIDIGANRIAVTASKITVTDLDDDETVYVYKDFGANYFNGDFTFELDFKCTDGSSTCGLWGMSEDLDTMGALHAANKDYLSLLYFSDDKIYIRSFLGGNLNQTPSSALSAGTDYYLTIKLDRKKVALTCDIYSDSGRQTLVESISTTPARTTDKFRYLYAAWGYGTLAGGETWDGEIRNLEMRNYPADTSFSRNPAKVLWHIYRNLENKSGDNLDTTEFSSLETYCDAVPTGGTLPRYRFDFIFDTRMSINDMKKLVWSSFHGCCIWSQGKIKPIWEKARSPIFSFTQDNIVAGSFSWSQPERPNIIKVHFINSGADWKKDTIEDRDETSITDNGEIVFEETAYYIINEEIARRRCKFWYNKFKYTDYACRFTGFPESSEVEVLDVVNVTHSLPGWTSKDFIVRSKGQDEYGRCVFGCEAYYSGVYDDGAVEFQQDYYSTLPNPFTAPGNVTNLALTESSTSGPNGIYVPTVVVDFDKPSDNTFWDHAEVWTKTSVSGATYSLYGISKGGTSFTVDGIRAGFYGFIQSGVTVYVKVRSINVHGVTEDFSSAVTQTEVIDQLPVAYFTVSPTAGKAMFSTVTAALSELPSAGGMIELKEGTHTLSAGGVTMPVDKAVYIYATARGGVTVQNTAGSHGFIICDASKDYKFSDFTLMSQNSSNYTAMIYSYGSGATNYPYLNNSADLMVNNVKFDLVGDGVQWSANGDYGIKIIGGNGRYEIQNNTFQKGRTLIYVKLADNVQILDNGVTGPQQYAFRIVPIAGKWGKHYRISLKDNLIQNFLHQGVYVQAGTTSGIRIEDNTFILHPTKALTAANVYGINSAARATISRNSIILHNSSATPNSIYGILEGVNESLLTDNEIDIEVVTEKKAVGIWNATNTDCQILGNRIRVINSDHTVESFGILSNSACQRNNISNNHIIMGNDANDIGIDTDGGSCQDNYGVGNSTYNVGANDIDALDDITINDV